jgi:hypothetical protein
VDVCLYAGETLLTVTVGSGHVICSSVTDLVAALSASRLNVAVLVIFGHTAVVGVDASQSSS